MKNRPFLLHPVAKDYLWGGNRLNDEFDKGINMSPLAETWECSTHNDGQSVIASGAYEGRTLAEVLEEHPEYIGTHPLENSNMKKNELPILIKLIDADKDLSIQVHPNDEYAYKYEGGQHGKTEMWYILDAKKDSTLVYGLEHNIDKERLESIVSDKTIERYVRNISVNKDDVFFIKPGMIHAIGEGILVAEIQENSNLTYRIYDYDRVDKYGIKRELHLDKAKEVADFNKNGQPRQSMRIIRYKKGCSTELLGRCKYFEVHKILLNTERIRTRVPFSADRSSFRVLLCISGCGSLSDDEENINFFKGDCIFVPADSVEFKLHGKAQLLDVRG